MSNGADKKVAEDKTNMGNLHSYLHSFTHSNIPILTTLYFVQGLPYGIQARFLPIYLRAKNVSLTNLGFIKLLLLPWLLKIVWAPLLDRYSSKQTWLLISMAGLMLASLAGAAIDEEHFLSLCVVVFFMNFFASTQDIAVDGIAVAILSADELGKGNTAQVVGYKLGSIVGGGGLVWLSDYVAWHHLFLFLSVTYLSTIVLVCQLSQLQNTYLRNYQSKSNRDCKDIETKTGNKCESNMNGYIPTSHTKDLKEMCNKETEGADYHRPVDSTDGEKKRTGREDDWWMLQVLRSPGTGWMIVYCLLYKLGEQGANGMFPLYLVDQGIPKGAVGMWTGVVGQGLSIVGSLLGGWLLTGHSNRTPLDLLHLTFTLRLLPIILQMVVIWEGNTGELLYSYGFAVASMCLLQLVGGVITTATFTTMMHCSRQAPSSILGSHYTSLATFEVMGKLLFMTVAGSLTDFFGYFNMYVFFAFLSVGVMPLLKYCPINFHKNE
ncbi:major facilitator superfamily domain-containing protein 3-like [Branchiostoma floridae]|uniref:Major facilitator superfamily domain-containing protein 3-like n=1 Tax=Branchiostoma floridae TaxID=7739 RepID=A0A9J7L682_BRAFL|nr:major facilitator superfamily domain-containing protein 3-like [Branchiostoma floridae]XP_035676301.1 major facilitator superfamily domain-containing protein 3-like [Branchiostoma floridae]